MMSYGAMLSAPMIPSYTSSRPIAEIASRKRLAIKGAVIKFIEKSNRTKMDLWPWWPWSRSSPELSEWYFLRRKTLKEPRTLKVESWSRRGK